VSGAHDTDEDRATPPTRRARYPENAIVDLVIAATASRAGQTAAPHDSSGQRQPSDA
jgi:hypothetical protein